MYFTKIDKEDESLYDFVKIDGKKFYCLKKNNKQLPPRRYSDQFKKKKISHKSLYKKIRILNKHKNDIENIAQLIDDWRDIIEKSIEILVQEYKFPINYIVKTFDLEKYGFENDDDIQSDPKYLNNSFSDDL